MFLGNLQRKSNKNIGKFHQICTKNIDKMKIQYLGDFHDAKILIISLLSNEWQLFFIFIFYSCP